MLFISQTLPYSFYSCVRNTPKIMMFVIGKMKLVSFSLFLDAPKMSLGQRHVAINIYNICKGHFASRCGGGGEVSENILKYTSFIFPMTNNTILGVFRMHAQKEYSKVLQMKSTYILNILALLFFLNKQCIYSTSDLNGTQYKDVK